MAGNRIASLLVSLCACVAASEVKADGGLFQLQSFSSTTNTFSIGVEGFYDHYTESASTGVVENSNYGSVDLRYINTNKQGYITEIDLRGSEGSDDYKSPSGTIKSIPQYEAEFRLLGGVNIPTGVWVMTPYVGLANRYFYDNNKGNHTNLGFFGYDRRIDQIYIPLGGRAKRTFNGWTYDTSLEYDQLIRGYVNSRLQNGGTGDSNLNNLQTHGYGFRGDFLVGQVYNKSIAWEIGPFFRYWNIPDSKVATEASTGDQLIEPKNQRLQVGLEGRVNF